MNSEEKRINCTVSERKLTLKGRPAGPRILVRVKATQEKLDTDSKIILPDEVFLTETFNTTKGVVVKMGLDCYNEAFKRAVGAKEPWCEVGDEIMFKSHSSIFEDLRDGLIVINDQDVVWNFSKE
jgi:co-chaperonin GroES (HSP10)